MRHSGRLSDTAVNAVLLAGVALGGVATGVFRRWDGRGLAVLPAESCMIWWWFGWTAVTFRMLSHARMSFSGAAGQYQAGTTLEEEQLKKEFDALSTGEPGEIVAARERSGTTRTLSLRSVSA